MVGSESAANDDHGARAPDRSFTGSSMTATPPASPIAGLIQRRVPSRTGSPHHSMRAQQDSVRSVRQSSLTGSARLEPSSPALSQASADLGKLTRTATNDGTNYHRAIPKLVSPKSSISLPSYRSKPPKLYWPTLPNRPRRPVLLFENILNPFDDFAERLLCAPVGISNKSYVFAARFEVENGENEWLAVKLTRFDNREDLNAAEEHGHLSLLQHNHIVAVAGAYKEVDESQRTFNLGLLLFPLAPTDLTKQITTLSEHNAKSTEPGWRPHTLATKMLSYFACLSRAVLYLHTKSIKHRDIKPGNILIDGADVVFLADFDLSRKYKSNFDVVSWGGTKFTKEYAPKTVINQEEQGLERDVNSLGFVFLEMATVIFGETHENMVNFLSGRKRCSRCQEWDHLEQNCEYIHSKRRKARASEGEEGKKEITVVFSDALEKGLINKWIDHLVKISKEFRQQMPHERFVIAGDDITENFLTMLLEMMRNRDQTDSSRCMRGAWTLFNQLAATSCEHCHPEKTNYGNPVVPDHQRLSPPTIEGGPGASASMPESSRETEDLGSSVRDSKSTQLFDVEPYTNAQPTTVGATSKVVSAFAAPKDEPAPSDIGIGGSRVDKTDDDGPGFRVSPATTRASTMEKQYVTGQSTTLMDTEIMLQEVLPSKKPPLSPFRDVNGITSGPSGHTEEESVDDGPKFFREDSTTIKWSQEGIPASTVVSKDDTVAAPPVGAQNRKNSTVNAYVNGRACSVSTEKVTGEWVAIFDPKRDTTRTMSVKTLLSQYRNQHEGFLIELPQSLASTLSVPLVGVMKFRKVFGTTMNLRRVFGRLRWMFVLGRLSSADKS